MPRSFRHVKHLRVDFIHRHEIFAAKEVDPGNTGFIELVRGEGILTVSNILGQFGWTQCSATEHPMDQRDEKHVSVYYSRKENFFEAFKRILFRA